MMILTNLLLSLSGVSGTPAETPKLDDAAPAPLQDAEAAPEPEWNGTLTAGVTKTSGNTEITSAVVLFDAIRESHSYFKHEHETESFWLFR